MIIFQFVIYTLASAPNEGRNNWCLSRLRDFDFETFRDFFILRDQKTSGAMAPVVPPSSAPLLISLPTLRITVPKIWQKIKKKKIWFDLNLAHFLTQKIEFRVFLF